MGALDELVPSWPLPRFWGPGGRWLNSKRRIVRRAALRRRVRPVYVGGDTVLCTVLGRYKMYVDSRDLSVCPHLIVDGCWEMWVTEAIAALLRPGSVAVDVGANIGYFTMIMADVCGGAGRVHAFEPNPALARRLARSLGINGFTDRVTLHAAPLADADGRPMHFVVADDHAGGGQVVPAEQLWGRDSLPVSTRRLDQVPGARDAEIVKIDAEGSEAAIWAGMAGMIAGTRLATVLLEFAPERHDDPRRFLQDARAAGFALGYVDESRGMLAAGIDELLTRRSVSDRMLLLRR